MRAAAAQTSFESAAELKQQLHRLDLLAGPAFTHVGDVRRARLALVLPGVRARQARILLLAGSRLGVVGDLALPAEDDALNRLAAGLLEAAPRAGPFGAGPGELDTLAAVTRWIYSPAARRRGTAIAFEDSAGREELAARLRVAAKSLSKPRAEIVPDQATEG